ncbi:hypothetical protein L0U88_12260 [Flavihumibacter sp. RY-1]|uniref:Uncharacterized protein n=1 Tax=Flavihumibacter fluminis TaxID=2909236 RepID=A0ABS9BI62_9BACT|nr:hypothetical protein [Flavihumibacter fluminis]MCF1715401.1 hypothetical protein [Flavihumibacter fluminis]
MSRRISKKELSQLLKNINFERNDLKLNDGDSADYHELFSKEILLTFSGNDYGVLFESESELKRFRNQVNFDNESHPLAGVFNSEEDFYECLSAAKNRISAYLKISESELNESIESLKIIDTNIKRQQLSLQAYYDFLYKYIICYIGMVIIQNRGGKWLIQFSEEKDILEPYVSLPTEKLVDVFTDAYADAYEDWDHFSIYTTAHMRLDSL